MSSETGSGPVDQRAGVHGDGSSIESARFPAPIRRIDEPKHGFRTPSTKFIFPKSRFSRIQVRNWQSIGHFPQSQSGGELRESNLKPSQYNGFHVRIIATLTIQTVQLDVFNKVLFLLFFFLFRNPQIDRFGQLMATIDGAPNRRSFPIGNFN